MTEYVAPAPAVALSVPSQQLRPAYTAATVATCVNLDVTGMVYPQFSSTAVEGSASQVVGSLPLGEVSVATGVNLDVTGMVYPQFSSTAVEGSATQVVGSLPLGEVSVATGVNLDATGMVYPQFSSTAVEGSASQVVGSLPLGEVSVATGVNLDVTGMVYPQFSSTAVEGSASQVVGSLPLGEVFAAPVFNQVHQEQLVGGEIPENLDEIPVDPEQVIVQAIPRVAHTLPPAEEFTEPVYNHFHLEQFSAGDTTENIANFPVVQEQVLVQAIPRLVGSSPPVDEFTAYVARRPLPLVEVQPSVRAQRHIVEDLGELAPLVQILVLPVSQPVDSVTDILRLLDRPIAEQVIAVPTVSCSSCPLRSCVPEPQLADQLVEVPTVLTPTRIALQIAERIVDTPVPRGRVHGSLPGQSSAMSLPESIEWVELSDANGRPWFWNRRTQATVRKAPPGVQVVWVGVKDEEGGTWYWHRRTRVTGYSLPPLPPE